MNDKRIISTLSVSIAALLFVAMFIPTASSRIAAAIILVPAAVVTWFIVKKRSILSINKRQVLLLMTVIGALWVTLLYLSGLKFGFYYSATQLSTPVVLRYVLPVTLSIISIEIIRSVLRAQEDKTADIVCYIVCILADCLVAANFGSIKSFNSFMDLMGLTLLPAVTANLLYHYISKRYGFLPIISYRLIISLYSFFIPLVPAVPDALKSFGSLILPLVIYLFISALFEKKKVTHKKTTAKTYVGIGAMAIVMISIVMIISCQFRICAIVIGTGSMTGELNVGDVAIYERYEEQVIQEGDVVVFTDGSSRIIHRVIEIEHTDEGAQYITKGDANEDPDIGFVTDDRIVGVVRFKLPYLGYPSMWARNLFSR